MMDEAKRAALAAAGFVPVEISDILRLTPAEEAMIATRLAIRDAVRDLRKSSGLSQAELAKAMGSTQSKVARIETVAVGVSLDLMLKALYTLGGTLGDLELHGATEGRKAGQGQAEGRTGRRTGQGASQGRGAATTGSKSEKVKVVKPAGGVAGGSSSRASKATGRVKTGPR